MLGGRVGNTDAKCARFHVYGEKLSPLNSKFLQLKVSGTSEKSESDIHRYDPVDVQSDAGIANY